MEKLDAAQSPDTGNTGNQKKLRVWLYIGAGILIIALIAAGLVLRNLAAREYFAGLEHYYNLSPAKAKKSFKLVSQYPGLLGSFVEDSKEKLIEIDLFQEAESAWEDKLFEFALEKYHQFLDAYPESPYYPVSLEAVNAIPFDWAEQAEKEKDFAGAIEILNRVDGEYMTKTAASNAELVLQSCYLEWGVFFLDEAKFKQSLDPLQTAYQGKDVGIRAQSEELIQDAYEGWAAESRAAQQYADAVEAYDGFGAWLSDAELDSPINLEQALAETYREWGDLFFDAESYPEAIEKYERAKAIEIPAITAGLDDRLALAYLKVGGQFWNSGSREEAVEHFASIILDHGTAPAAAEIPTEAASDLLAYAKALNPDDEFAQAAAIFTYLGSADLSEALAMENLVSWADVLYQSELDANYLESLRKLDQASALAAQSEQELGLTEVEALHGQVIQAISTLEDGLGKLILHAIRAVEIDDVEFPICEIVDEEEVCLDEADYQLVMGAVGIDEEIDRFVHGGDLNEELTAKTPGEAQFFIRFIYTSKKIQSCPYTASAAMPYRTYFLQRHRRVTEVVVTDLQTGFKVGYETFIGGEPQGCPSVRRFNPQSQYAYSYGPDPDASQIYSWLLDFTR